MSDQSMDQYGPFAYLFLVIFCTLLFLVGRCGSCLGIEYWSGDPGEKSQQRKEAREAKKHCTAECSRSYPDTWKEPDHTSYSVCFDAC